MQQFAAEAAFNVEKTLAALMALNAAPAKAPYEAANIAVDTKPACRCFCCHETFEKLNSLNSNSLRLLYHKYDCKRFAIARHMRARQKWIQGREALAKKASAEKAAKKVADDKAMKARLHKLQTWRKAVVTPFLTPYHPLSQP